VGLFKRANENDDWLSHSLFSNALAIILPSLTIILGILAIIESTLTIIASQHSLFFHNGYYLLKIDYYL